MVDEVVAELALDAEQALVGLAVQGLGTDHGVVLDLQLQLAADAAVGTGGGDLLRLKGTEADPGLGQQRAHGADGDAVAAGDAVGGAQQPVEGVAILAVKPRCTMPMADAPWSFWQTFTQRWHRMHCWGS